ncbi:putative BRI1 kinase inhibitor 1 [Panicum miliaceum]|uniref:BRI1 kinase inhibitor 1 n=1 Tax=Panicum miliaceum TaxID=4540 RepID=A0A3L6RLQ1_PANMI|nr:putative BRI1 kinase inhibitor 1 [Panicum miliaceum]
MSHRLGRVVSDLTHSNSRGAAGQQGLHRQSTTPSNNEDRGNVGGRARQRLALLFSGVVAWTRSENSGETGSSSSSREKNRKQKQQTANGGGPGARRRGLDIVLALRKYVSMVEQLFASYSGASSARRDEDARDVRRRRPHTFTYARGGGGGGASSSSSSRRHKGRLSSAPASLRGSPANSGHLAVGESVTSKASTPSEVSTMEELHSAIQAAIAHCKSSAGVGGGEPQPPRA